MPSPSSRAKITCMPLFEVKSILEVGLKRFEAHTLHWLVSNKLKWVTHWFEFHTFAILQKVQQLPVILWHQHTSQSDNLRLRDTSHSILIHEEKSKALSCCGSLVQLIWVPVYSYYNKVQYDKIIRWQDNSHNQWIKIVFAISSRPRTCSWVLNLYSVLYLLYVDNVLYRSYLP